MPLLQLLARAFMINRLLRGGSRRGRRRSSGWGMAGPFPRYTRRGRRSNVTVTGCCLPIPLALALGSLLGLRRLIAR